MKYPTETVMDRLRLRASGLTYGEIARRHGITAPAVRESVWRASRTALGTLTPGDPLPDGVEWHTRDSGASFAMVRGRPDLTEWALARLEAKMLASQPRQDSLLKRPPSDRLEAAVRELVDALRAELAAPLERP